MPGISLLQFHLSTGFFQKGLQLISFVLGNTLLHWTRSSIYQSFGFDETQAKGIFNSFYYLQFGSTSRSQNYIEFSFFSNCRSIASTSRRTSSNSHCSSSRLNTVVTFHNNSQFLYFFYSQVNQLFCKTFQISHCKSF